MRGRVSGFQFGLEGEQYISFRLTEDGRKEYEELKDKPDLVIEAKPYRKRRSLDANSYLWVVCEKIGQKIGSSKDEVYLTLLERYGVFTHLIVKPAAVERVKKEWRTVRELGEVKVGEQTGIQLQCYFGSSTYDSKEMSRLIDGAIQEADNLGIETATPDEVAKMKGLWDATEDKGVGDQPSGQKASA